MSIESPVEYEDEVFAGEHKVLRWTVRDKRRAPVSPDGWTNVTVTFYRRRNDVPVLTRQGTVTTEGDDLVIVSTLTASDTATLGVGSFHYACARTDAGAEQVIAHGPFVIRDRRT